jgi:hypothetical protein
MGIREQFRRRPGEAEQRRDCLQMRLIETMAASRWRMFADMMEMMAGIMAEGGTADDLAAARVQVRADAAARGIDLDVLDRIVATGRVEWAEA